MMTVSRQYVAFETYLWAVFSLCAIYCYPTKRSLFIALTNLVTRCMILTPPSQQQRGPTHNNKQLSRKHAMPTDHWRHQSQENGDASGLGMSLVLLPVLLEAMDQFSSSSVDNDSSMVASSSYERYALIYTVSSIGTDFNIPALIAFTIFQPDTLLHDWKGLLFVAIWLAAWFSVRIFDALQGVWTRGEWIIVTSMIAMACAECLVGTRETWNEEHVHQFVALSGWMSCMIACIIGHCLGDFLEAMQHQHIRLAIPQELIVPVCLLSMALVTFTGIELLLYTTPSIADMLSFPRSINWIIDFLFHAELAPVHILGMPVWRRITWIIYWIVLVLLAIPLAPNNSPVIARKWFHAFAILLFTPVSMSCPILQSLGYAVALCVLMVLEGVRHDVPALNAFYERYIDVDKDGTASHCIIVSHMCLIFGCAAPLWIGDILNLGEYHSETLGLLSLWGVLCLGVGDSMGAIVGKNLGRIKWGKSRTVEGSLAMLVSMLALYLSLALYFDLFDAEQAFYWIPAMIFVTFLEAFTHQIDNMVLPLAGVAVLLMSRHAAGWNSHR